MSGGDNIDAATSYYVERWLKIAKKQADLKAEIDEIKGEIKGEGFNVKVMAQMVRERMRGAKYCADQLTLELELNTYRAAVGLPTTVEDAQERARQEAAEVPVNEGNEDEDDPTLDASAHFVDPDAGNKRKRRTRH